MVCLGYFQAPQNLYVPVTEVTTVQSVPLSGGQYHSFEKEYLLCWYLKFETAQNRALPSTAQQLHFKLLFRIVVLRHFSQTLRH